jgi:hypothetical protein
MLTVSVLFAIAAVALSTFVILPEAQSVLERVAQSSDLLARINSPDYTRTRTFDAQTNSLRRAQGTIPKGETFIAYTNTSLLLDFSRNRIYVVDWPYGSSRAPGMPRGQGGDAIDDYLISMSIRYMLYDKSREGYPGGSPECRSQTTAAPVLQRSGGQTGEDAYECAMDLATADFLQSLSEIAASRESVFADGNLVVLDLSKHR